MTLGNILNQTALIAGGAALPNVLGAYQGPGGIVGVKKAWSRVPDTIEPYTHVSFPGSGTIEPPESGERINIVRHQFPMRLFVQEWGPNTEQAVNDLVPFLDRYKAAYPAKTELNGACLQAAIEAYSTGVYTFAGTQWLIFEFTFVAWEIDTSILYSA